MITVKGYYFKRNKGLVEVNKQYKKKNQAERWCQEKANSDNVECCEFQLEIDGQWYLTIRAV